MDNYDHMAHKTQNRQALKIAAPYYGALSHPTRGLSNLYFLIDIHPEEQKVAHMHVTVWNPSDSRDLGDWLKNKGVKALVCNAIEYCHQLELQKTGIKIESVSGSDIIHEIKNWLVHTAAELLNSIDPASDLKH